MICLICRQAGIVNGFTSVKFERGEIQLVINNIPARVCPGCGEAYVDEKVASRLLQSLDEIYKAGMRKDEIDYDYS